MIALENIRKAYPTGPVSVEVLKGASLYVHAGDLVAIVGKSGSGKSTLMNIIGLLDLPTTGRYTLNGTLTGKMSDDELSGIRNQEIGFVFQQFNLLPRLTALQNVGLPLVYRGVSEKERNRMARQMLAKVDLLDRARHRPAELSGGQQQRVAIARALVGGPSLLLADEPTGALDGRVGQAVMDLFTQLNRDEGITIIIITHDLGIAQQCNHHVRLQGGILQTSLEPMAVSGERRPA